MTNKKSQPAKKLKSKIQKKAVIFQGVDAPLVSPKDDCLNRDSLAKRIFETIESSPKDSNIRVGIFGDWGFGKTSTMNFIKWYCQESKQPFATINPWHFKTREEAWEGFSLSIDKGIAEWQGKSITTFKRKKGLKKVSGMAREIATLASSTIGKAIASLILSPLEGMLNIDKKVIQDLINNTLKDKRLYIFIDDLDRADFNVAYDFLLFLNEFCDFNKCVYIISLDRKMASKIIQKKTGISEAEGYEFLEKIINWAIDLPKPSEYGWRQMLDNEIENISEDVNINIMEEILSLLPQNPRKFKHFLRYISSLHKCFIHRFNDYELNKKVLYLAQLLRVEFPNEFEQFNQKDYLINNLKTSIMDDYLHEEKKKKAPRPELSKQDWELKIDKIFENREERKERFIEIYKALRGECKLMSYGQIKNHVLVIEDPEPLTWKEYNDFALAFKNKKSSEIKHILSNFIQENLGQKRISKIQEFIRMLSRERHTLLSQISDTASQKIQKTLMRKVYKIMLVSSKLIELDVLFDTNNPLFDYKTFSEWFHNLTYWTHFKQPKSVYERIRQDEAKLLEKLLKKLLQKRLYLFELEDTLGREAIPVVDSQKEFEPIRKKLKEILDKTVSEYILERFDVGNGIKELFSDKYYRIKKDIFINPKAFFYNKKLLQKIEKRAKSAHANVTIQMNFFFYIEIMFDEISKCGDTKDIKNILSKKWVNLFWKSALSYPLNLRFVGSLEAQRKQVINKIFNGKDKSLPLPKWYKEMIKELNARKKASNKKTGRQ